MHESWCPNHAAAQPKPKRRLEKELSKQKCVLIPRIILSPTETKYLFTLRSRLFPVHISWGF
ncbi:unnamed protein product [Brassica oleracea var. botrytis]